MTLTDRIWQILHDDALRIQAEVDAKLVDEHEAEFGEPGSEPTA